MPLSDEELERLATDLESDRVERKAELGDKGTQRKLRRTLCAFANDLPNHGTSGVLVLGVDDDGVPTGLQVDQRLLDSLSSWPRDNTFSSPPTVNIQRRRVRGADVAVVEVFPHPDPPVRFRGRVWVRVGATVQVATPAEELRLLEKRRAADLPFDVRPVPAARVDDLDVERFRTEYLPAAVAEDIIERNERTVAEQLAALRFVSPGPDGVPTVLGLLVAGWEPTRFIPGAYVQFLRFDGRDVTSPVRDQRVIEGPLVDLVRRTEEILEARISVATDLSGPVEKRRPDYPFLALREVFRNAVMHRDYEGSNAPVVVRWFKDRVEIVSPGGPYGSVTRENFGEPYAMDYRNRELAGAMRDLDLAQRWGWGLQNADKALEDNGNPKLDLDPMDTHVRVVVLPPPRPES